MRSLSMVAAGMVLAATTGSAEPLRLADTDLDRATVAVGSANIVARIVQAEGLANLDTNINIIRFLDAEQGDLVLVEARDASDRPIDVADLAPPPSNDDPADANRGNEFIVLSGEDLPGSGVASIDQRAIAGNNGSTTGSNNVNSQVVVRSSSSDSRTVVQGTNSFVSVARTDTAQGDSGRQVAAENASSARQIGGFEQRLQVRAEAARKAAGIRMSRLLSGDAAPGLTPRRLDTGIASNEFANAAFTGGFGSSLLNSPFN